jgi:hypothetical protein
MTAAPIPKGLPRAISAAIAAMVCVLSDGPARAYRPFDGTDAGVAATGEFELELGPVGFLRSGHERYWAVPTVVANLGVFQRIELVLTGRELVSLASPHRASLVDTGAFLKAVIRKGSLHGGVGPSLATEVGALLPTVNGDPGAGASATLLVSQVWPAAAVHINIQGSLTRAGNPDTLLGVILEGPHEWTARPVIECTYENEFGAYQTFSGLVGFIARANDRLSFDAATRAAEIGGVTAFEARAGFTWTLGLWGRQE